MSVAGIYRMRHPGIHRKRRVVGYQPLSGGERCAEDMEKRFRSLRQRMGKRSSASGMLASAIMWFVRPLFPSWRDRVRRIRREMIDRAMPRYSMRMPPTGMRPPIPPPNIRFSELGGPLPARPTPTGTITAWKIAAGTITACAPNVFDEPAAPYRTRLI